MDIENPVVIVIIILTWLTVVGFWLWDFFLRDYLYSNHWRMKRGSTLWKLITAKKSIDHINEGMIHDWEKLAASIGLKFISGEPSGLALITGIYKKHSVTLEIEERVLGVKYTSILVTNNTPDIEPKEPSPIHDLDKLLSLVKKTKTFVRGEIKIEQYGQQLYYEQLGIEYDRPYMRFILNLLVDLTELYPKVVALGGKAITPVQRIPADVSETHLFQQIAPQLLSDIAEETTERLKHNATRLLCPDCFTRCIEHRAEFFWTDDTFTFYGCRVCQQSQSFFELSDEVVAVLDSKMTDDYVQHNGEFQVNWLVFQKLFDFDSVLVRQATDEDVERFAVQVGNDTVEGRKSRYSQIHCKVSSNCELSENTLRVLDHTFGNVEMF